MTRLLVGHDFNEDLRTRHSAAWYCQRLAWFAEDGDVLVLPVAPDEGWLEYVGDLTGTDPATLAVVVPPPGAAGSGQLTKDRLRDPRFLAELRAAVAGRPVEYVYALWPDARVVELAAHLGAERAVPGYRFLTQGGDAIANSKAFFRAVASGIGLPVAEGTVVRSRQAAEEEILRLLDDDHPVMLKNEFLSGGWGNEILTRRGGVRRLGARRLVELEGRSSVREYLEERWPRLTDAGRHELVVERYFPESQGVFAEFSIEDDGVHYGGQGHLLSTPYGGASITPAADVDPDRMAEVVSGGRQLCEAMRAIGYRGVLSADAIVTPAGQVMFTEYNGRSTGSTHGYQIVGRKIIGPDYAEDRVIVERLGTDAWCIESFAEAVQMLRASGLQYDPQTRRGVVFLHAFDPGTTSVPYVVIDESIAAAAEIEVQLGKAFDFVPRLT
ncbi:MAG TPA: peptide ligase PGM1-related protein [Actinocrinis sp.]|uniref:preATP grasp domain-containing protein n=1 Tax=Actinocrinis sp. TaxID=1920516 RepID=UPI002DDCE629|nr:peptide ligase PGM1-related protein [Actinocrinis sp.]HEV2343281.1 peptide ligase PGM1-related protein [Actinocrinis sp.]